MPEEQVAEIVAPTWLKVTTWLLLITTGIILVILCFWWRQYTAKIDDLTSRNYVGKTDTGDFLKQGMSATTGQLTVDGKAIINGDLHVTGTITTDQNNISVSNSAGNYYTNYFAGGCSAQVICNSTLLQTRKEFVIQPSSPYVVGATVRGNTTQAVDLLQLQNASGYSMINVTANGRLGVNNPSPQYNVDVNGQGRFLGHTAYGNVSAVDNPSILTPLTGTPVIRVNGTQEVVTNLTPGYNYYSGASSEYFVNLGQSANSQYFTGGYHAGEIVSGNPQDYLGLAGETGLAVHEGTGNINLMSGILGYTFNNSSGNIGAAAGTFGFLKNNDSGNIDTGVGAGGVIENPGVGVIGIANGLSSSVINGGLFGGGSGSIGNANGVSAGVTNNSSGTIDNVTVYDVQPVVNNGGAIGNVRGIYIGDQSAVANVSGVKYNLESMGNNSTNLFHGAVGVGSGAAPTNKLTVTDTTTNNVAKFNGTGVNQCTVVAGTGWSCSSDETLKTNILSISNGLGVITQLQGVTYNWKSDPNGTRQDGFIAQDIQKILPELVTTDSNGKLSLNKDGIMPFIVEAIKEQNGNLDKTNQQLSDQGIKLTSLSDELVALTKRVDQHDVDIEQLKAQVQQLNSRLQKLEPANTNSTNTTTTP
ncbi:MAG: tail fiber domain-containing protein [Candidatus Saccharibacteria bacterium]